MKFVANKDFANVKSLGIKLEKPLHERHVHKGARFEIGTAEKFEDLAKDDQVKVVALLSKGGAGMPCAVDASDEKAVRKIDNEVKIEQAQAAQAKAAAQPLTIESLTAAVTAAVLKALAPPAAKAA